MEPVTFAAIAGFLMYKSAESAVDETTRDAYEYLKNKLKGKFGEQSEIADAVSRLENKPNSEARREVLREEAEEAEIDQDSEISTAAKELLDLVNDQPEGTRYTQTASGSNIAQAQDSSTASVETQASRKKDTE